MADVDSLHDGSDIERDNDFADADIEDDENAIKE
jgi:hypothetical protein